MSMACVLRKHVSPKNSKMYLSVKEPMFVEVMKCSHKFANLKKANCLLFSFY